MSTVDAEHSASNLSSIPTPVPIGSNPALWIIIIGALFGLVTLAGLFTFAYLASTNPLLCSSFQFQLLAGGFALGAALAGSFIGGGAGAQGRTGSNAFNLAFGLTGGAALLIITLAVFSYFAPKGCDVLRVEQMQTSLGTATVDLANARTSLDQVSTKLSAAFAERDAATAANAAARAEIRRLIAAVQAAFPAAGELSGKVSSVTNLVTQSCSGGRHGTDPGTAGEIRSIVADASRRIASADTAIAGIVASVPAELRK